VPEIHDFVGGPYSLLVAADHGGFDTKRQLIDGLRANGVVVDDVGPHCFDAQDDYPDFAFPLARRIASGEAKCGLLICRTGIGMSINANRFPGVRAALADTVFKATRSREHNCSNVLVTGGDALTVDDMIEITLAWLNTPFSTEERHRRRLEKIERNSVDPFLELRRGDPELASLLDADLGARNRRLSMIASEGGATAATRSASAPVLSEKYVEGAIADRSYRGCDYADRLEKLAESRFCELFGAEAANLQPYSGSVANLIALHALAPEGGTLLSLDPMQGGHRTHGGKGSITGDLWHWQHYGIDPQTGDIDWAQLEQLATDLKPAVIVAGGSWVPGVIDFERLGSIAASSGARLLADVAHVAGLIAGGLHPSPVPYADAVTFTTHKSLCGPRGAAILCKAEHKGAIDSAISPWLQGGIQVDTLSGKAAAARSAGTPAFRKRQETIVAATRQLGASLQHAGHQLSPANLDGHMLLLQVANATAAADALEVAGILADPLPPLHGSEYLRLGVAAGVHRGLGPADFTIVAGIIDVALKGEADTASNQLAELLANHPYC
jgi:glycine hydroxymethyltransferase